MIRHIYLNVICAGKSWRTPQCFPCCFLFALFFTDVGVYKWGLVLALWNHRYKACFEASTHWRTVLAVLQCSCTQSSAVKVYVQLLLGLRATNRREQSRRTCFSLALNSEIVSEISPEPMNSADTRPFSGVESQRLKQGIYSCTGQPQSLKKCTCWQNKLAATAHEETGRKKKTQRKRLELIKEKANMSEEEEALRVLVEYVTLLCIFIWGGAVWSFPVSGFLTLNVASVTSDQHTNQKQAVHVCVTMIFMECLCELVDLPLELWFLVSCVYGCSGVFIFPVKDPHTLNHQRREISGWVEDWWQNLTAQAKSLKSFYNKALPTERHQEIEGKSWNSGCHWPFDYRVKAAAPPPPAHLGHCCTDLLHASGVYIETIFLRAFICVVLSDKAALVNTAGKLSSFYLCFAPLSICHQ